jgi:hypothetical protein
MKNSNPSFSSLWKCSKIPFDDYQDERLLQASQWSDFSAVIRMLLNRPKSGIHSRWTGFEFATVKAYNFGPHVNFGIFFSKRLAIFKTRSTEKWKKKMKVVKRIFDLHIRFCLFLVNNSSEEATEIASKGSRCPWGSKLEAFSLLQYKTSGQG